MKAAATLMRERAARSIGIVAMNQAQRDLIETLMDEKTLQTRICRRIASNGAGISKTFSSKILGTSSGFNPLLLPQNVWRSRSERRFDQGRFSKLSGLRRLSGLPTGSPSIVERQAKLRARDLYERACQSFMILICINNGTTRQHILVCVLATSPAGESAPRVTTRSLFPRPLGRAMEAFALWPAGTPASAFVQKTRASPAIWSRLMANAQDGDQVAYRALLEDIVPYLRALAARRFKEASDIDDSVQDILLTIHAIRHTYDPRRPFGPWLVTIANRRIVNGLRQQLRVRSRETELTAEHENFSAGVATPPSDRDVTSANDAALRTAIERLPPDQRQAIRLLKLKEMSLKEAAVASGRSISALKVATHRAIKGLRKILKQGTTQ
jgi:RNA polymerase sigma-70 factor (ECF subfamily)